MQVYYLIQEWWYLHTKFYFSHIILNFRMSYQMNWTKFMNKNIWDVKIKVWMEPPLIQVNKQTQVNQKKFRHNLGCSIGDESRPFITIIFSFPLLLLYDPNFHAHFLNYATKMTRVLKVGYIKKIFVQFQIFFVFNNEIRWHIWRFIMMIENNYIYTSRCTYDSH